MKKSVLIFLLMFIFLPAFTFASIQITTADLCIDKPSYSTSYSFGVDVSAITELSIASVYAEHITTSSHDLGTWSLTERSSGRWFEWASKHVTHSNGPITGEIKLTITTETGEQFVAESLIIPDDIELEFVSGLELVIDKGYRLLMDEVNGADSYSWTIYDSETRKSVASGRTNHPSEFPTIPYTTLQSGRSYIFSGRVQNHFSCGSYDLEASSLFRSYDHIDFVAVPEPCSLILLALGGIMLRSRRKA